MRRIAAFLTFVILITSLFGCASNNMKTADLMELEESRDIVISVSWDTEEPDIEIVSPDKTVYDPQKVDEELVIRTDGTLFMLIRNPAPGKWKARCDKKSNEHVNVSVDWYINE